MLDKSRSIKKLNIGSPSLNLNETMLLPPINIKSNEKFGTKSTLNMHVGQKIVEKAIPGST